MQLEPVQILETSERFVIERELGHGGMGVVFQAFDRERGARVALKALTQIDAAHIYRLKHEFRQLSDLSHPNLVTLHELVHEGEAWFFTMELVDGQTFDRHCWERGTSSPPEAEGSEPPVTRRYPRDVSTTLSQPPLVSDIPRLPRMMGNERRIRRAVQQLVEAINALHEAGRLHRDIKPSNVLVTPMGRVVVLDFGLVSRTNGDSIDPDRALGGSVFGTPAYMSPEQAVGEPLSPASDWYSVGAMLYEALTGQLPFDGTILEILRQKEELEPVPPSELARDVPDDLDQLCRDLLRRDPAARPSGREILGYLTDQSTPQPAFDGQSATVLRPHGELFVGRTEQLDELRDAFRTACSGKPVAVFVHGDSGMGKTALVRRFANELIQRGDAVVLRGRCYERESVPYKAFDDIADALARYLIGLDTKRAAALLPRNAHALPVLFPVLRRARVIAEAPAPRQAVNDARELRNQAFGALKELLLRISDLGPLVINIDDLQWADLDSARLLSFLLGPPEAPPLLLVATYRREAEQGPFLQQLLAEGPLVDGTVDLRKLAIDPLCQSEAEELAGVLLRDQRADDVELRAVLAAEAQGAPFFIAELVRHRQLRLERGATSGALSLEGVLADRIASLPEGARQLLHVLSVAGGPLEQGVAIDAARLPRGDRTATMALRAARLIRTRGTRETDTAESYHDRIRETVVHGLSGGRVRDIHERIVETLQLHDIRDPERLIPHLVGAGDTRRAGEAAVEAARAAVKKLAFNRAAELFKLSIELMQPTGVARVELHEQLGDALANAGRGALAADAYLEAREGLGADTASARARFERLAAQQLLRAGHVDRGLALATKILAEVQIPVPASTPGLIAVTLAERALIAALPEMPRRPARLATEMAAMRAETLASVFKECTGLDPLLGTYLQSRYLREALRAGGEERMLQGLAWEAINLAVASGDAKRKRVSALLARTQALANRVGTPYARATVALAQAAANMSWGEVSSVAALSAEAETTFREACHGASWEVAFSQLWRYGAIELDGPLSTIRREAPEAVRDANERGDLSAIGLLTVVVPMASLLRDDPAAALEHLKLQEHRLPRTRYTSFHLWVFDRTVDTHLYRGDTEVAWREMLVGKPRFERSFLARAPLLCVNAAFLEGRTALAYHAATGDRRALGALRRAIRALEGYRRPDASVYAALLGAGLASRTGVGDPLALLGMAETLGARSGLRNFALYARRNRACLEFLRHGDRAALDGVDAELRAQGIDQPKRWVATYAPGFSEP